MINKIWYTLITVGIIYAAITNKIDTANNAILTSGEKTINIMLFLIPNLVLWNAVMKIAEKSGLLDILSNKLKPLLIKLFPEIPKNHIAFNYISSNFVVNILGLSNAATPIGLKAMSELNTLNKNKTTASKSMITFLVLNTTGLTLVPTTMIALRASYQSSDPSTILIPTIIATIICSIAGLILDRWYQRKYDKHK